MSVTHTVGNPIGQLDIFIKQGNNESIVLALHDDAGIPMNLSGYSIKMDIKNDENVDSVPLISKSVGTGITVDGHAIKVSFGDETLGLKLPAYYYDILFVKGSEKRRLVEGRLLVDKSVTK